jgi:hypothetical protein
MREMSVAEQRYQAVLRVIGDGRAVNDLRVVHPRLIERGYIARRWLLALVWTLKVPGIS